MRLEAQGMFAPGEYERVREHLIYKLSRDLANKILGGDAHCVKLRVWTEKPNFQPWDDGLSTLVARLDITPVETMEPVFMRPLVHFRPKLSWWQRLLRRMGG